MRARNIGVQLHYSPIHLQPYYQNLGFFRGQFPEAEKYYEEAILDDIKQELIKNNILK